MGADEAVVIDDPALTAPDQAAVAAALAAAVKKLGACDLLLFGEGSTRQLHRAGRRAAWPSCSASRRSATRARSKRRTAWCAASAAWTTCSRRVEAPLPAAVTVVSEINEPRIPGLMQIMKAKSKPMQTWSLADLGIEAPAPVREVVSNLAEEQDRKHILFEGTAAEQADAFVNALIKEGVLGR